MAGWLVTLFIIGAQIFLHHPLTILAGGMPSYSYAPGSPSGPDMWGTLSPQWQLCKDGKEQSPVAINISHMPINQSLGNLEYMYKTANGVLINMGHTVQVNLEAGAGSLVLDNDHYDLKQLHFHTPSEHVINSVRFQPFLFPDPGFQCALPSINGRTIREVLTYRELRFNKEVIKFPLEMHLVHQTPDGKKLAAIGVVFWKSCSGHFLDQFWDSLPLVPNKGANVSIGPLDFNKLHIGPTYARYPGSLTTPPCTQNVSWTVELSQWNTVSESQLDALKAIMSEPNARPLQQNIASVEFY